MDVIIYGGNVITNLLFRCITQVLGCWCACVWLSMHTQFFKHMRIGDFHLYITMIIGLREVEI